MAVRRVITVDGGQYEEMQQYCDTTGATKAWVAREAIALWLRTVKPRMMKPFSDKAHKKLKPMLVKLGEHHARD